MTIKQQWTAVGVFVLVVAAGLFGATRFMGDELFPLAVGARAPVFHATTLDIPARPKTLADYKGQVVLLNIWATWCEPCQVEMPSIERLEQTLGPDGLKIVAVSIDDPGTDPDIRKYAQKFGLTFEILHDASKHIGQQYQTTGVPETFIIGRDGVIRKKIIGATNWDSEANRTLITHLLAEPAT